jgi:hypothetical protein
MTCSSAPHTAEASVATGSRTIDSSPIRPLRGIPQERQARRPDRGVGGPLWNLTIGFLGSAPSRSGSSVASGNQVHHNQSSQRVTYQHLGRVEERRSAISCTGPGQSG